MLKQTLAAVALFWATATNANYGEWTYIGTTDSGTVIHAQTSDLLKGRSYQTAAPVWVKMDSSRDRTVSFMRARTLYVINCVVRTSRSMHITAYFRDGTTRTEGVQAETFIVPETYMDTVADMLCSDPAPEPNYR